MAQEPIIPSFTARYTPGRKPVTLVLLPALFVGDWLWDETWNALNNDGWPTIRFDQAVSTIDRKTARSINRIAGSILQTCRQFTSGPLAVCGDSLGGLICFEFAKSYRADTAGIVASGAPGLNLKVTNFARDIAKGVRSPREFADKFIHMLLHDPEQYDIDKERYQSVVDELAKKENFESMLGALAAIRAYEVKKLLPTLDAPCLFLWGKYDQITPVEPWEEAVKHMKDARLAVFDDCGHAPMWEKPDEFNGELLAFLERLASELPATHTAKVETV
jgi:2-hydroxy-6-oxonona-2,4-dienedioate hydrolase